MKLVEVVILVGSQCLSPMQSGAGLTDVAKVQCAVLIRQDPKTSDVEIIPQAAATDPDVIAMLVKPRGSDAVASNSDDVTGSTSRAPEAVPRIVATADEPPAPVSSAKPLVRKKVVERAPAPPPAPAKRASLRKRSDACGSYKAVWYTKKGGHRRYRCVKTG